MTGSSKVKSAEYDLPRKVHCVPKLRVIEPKSDHILPEFLDVSSMSCQDLEAGASR